MRKLELYVKKYGTEAGQKLYHMLQSQAAHAGVSARLRKKLLALRGQAPAQASVSTQMSLFQASEPEIGFAAEFDPSSLDTPGPAEVLPAESDDAACYRDAWMADNDRLSRAEPIPGSC